MARGSTRTGAGSARLAACSWGSRRARGGSTSPDHASSTRRARASACPGTTMISSDGRGTGRGGCGSLAVVRTGRATREGTTGAAGPAAPAPHKTVETGMGTAGPGERRRERAADPTTSTAAATPSQATRGPGRAEAAPSRTRRRRAGEGSTRSASRRASSASRRRRSSFTAAPPVRLCGRGEGATSRYPRARSGARRPPASCGRRRPRGP